MSIPRKCPVVEGAARCAGRSLGGLCSTHVRVVRARLGVGDHPARIAGALRVDVTYVDAVAQRVRGLTDAQTGLLAAIGLDGPAAVRDQQVTVDVLRWPIGVAQRLTALGLLRRSREPADTALALHAPGDVAEVYLLTTLGDKYYALWQRWRRSLRRRRQPKRLKLLPSPPSWRDAVRPPRLEQWWTTRDDGVQRVCGVIYGSGAFADGTRVVTSEVIRAEGLLLFVVGQATDGVTAVPIEIMYLLGQPEAAFVAWTKANGFPFEADNPLRRVAALSPVPASPPGEA